jgi:hypothetical protein
VTASKKEREAMAYEISRVGYYYTTVPDRPGEAYELLSVLSEQGINLLAFAAVPFGPTRTQLTLFPDDSLGMEAEARKAGLALDGPHPALLVRGDDELGALARIHEKLKSAGVNVFASSGIADGGGSFGYLLYVRPDEFDRAVSCLDI